MACQRLRIAFVFSSMLLVAAFGSTPAQKQGESGEVEGAQLPEDQAEAAVTVLLRTEKALLTEDLQDYRSLVTQRNQTTLRLTELASTLDGVVLDPGTTPKSRLRSLILRISRTQSDLSALNEQLGRLATSSRDRRRKIRLLEQQLAELAGREQEPQGILTGRWELVFRPLEQRGNCELEQNGTLVTGTYNLTGGLSGSFEGTLVQRKLVLERIDSRLGRIMSLEGYLSSDGQRISGTWLNYELAGGEGATGQWTATRRP